MLTPQNINVYKSSEVFVDAHKQNLDFGDPLNIFWQLARNGDYTWGSNDKTLAAVDGIWGYIEGEDLSRGDRERLESLPPGSYIDLEN